MFHFQNYWTNFDNIFIGGGGIDEGVNKSFRTGRLDQEVQMLELSATRCSCITILWVSLVSFAAITLCVSSQRMFIVIVYFVIDSVRKLLDTPSYTRKCRSRCNFCLTWRTNRTLSFFSEGARLKIDAWCRIKILLSRSQSHDPSVQAGSEETARILYCAATGTGQGNHFDCSSSRSIMCVRLGRRRALHSNGVSCSGGDYYCYSCRGLSC
jgi:hypothetical protein